MGRHPMASIGEQLQSYRATLAEAQAQGDQAIARKIEQQIKDLEDFQQRHPEATEAPSPLKCSASSTPRT
jgi:hypothetical protein